MELNENKLVFVVEDSSDMRALINEILVGEGFRVEQAHDGADGIQKLSEMKEKPAVILLDLMMPVMDGFEFSARQKQDPRLADIPVILMSADSRLDAKSERIGASKCLKKPIEIVDLIEAVENFAR